MHVNSETQIGQGRLLSNVTLVNEHRPADFIMSISFQSPITSFDALPMPSESPCGRAVLWASIMQSDVGPCFFSESSLCPSGPGIGHVKPVMAELLLSVPLSLNATLI